MSILGALSSAISGLNAQSAAFGNISDNVANSQTLGFKRVDTNFVDYLDVSTATENEPGSVVARPDYINNVQGTISQTDNPLALAINGQGFFVASHATSQTNGGQPVFATQPYYTRAGDFQLDKNGYLVNGAGEYLNGWVVPQGKTQPDKSQVVPIQVSQTVYKPVATSSISFAANLPTGYTSGPDPNNAANTVVFDSTGKQINNPTSQVNVYDSQGTAHQVTLTWTPVATSSTPSTSWTVNISNTDSSPATDLGTVLVGFNADGTIASLGQASGSAGTISPTTTQTAGSPASLTFNAPFATPTSSSQTITLGLGTFGRTDGVTEFAGSSYTLRNASQDGVPPGSYQSLTTDSSGDIYANYDNGQSRLVAQVPVTTFSNPDALQRQDGSSFTVTLGSGNPLIQDAGTNGSGHLVTSSTESSNVDTATELSKLIVAQRAYSANAKIVTTADELMQTALDMKR